MVFRTSMGPPGWISFSSKASIISLRSKFRVYRRGSTHQSEVTIAGARILALVVGERNRILAFRDFRAILVNKGIYVNRRFPTKSFV